MKKALSDYVTRIPLRHTNLQNAVKHPQKILIQILQKRSEVCHVSRLVPLILAIQSGVMWDTFCVQVLSLQQPEM